jgi:hypothetical protein
MATRKGLKFDIRTGREIDDDDPVLRDGQRIFVPLNMCDSQQREVIQHFQHLRAEDALAQHRPGPRYIVDEAARARVEQARAEGIREMCDAWRKPVADAAGEFRGQQPGDVCTVREGGVDEGSPGHLRMVTGELRCVPDQRRTDAVPRVMDAATAQRIRDEAWEESVRRDENAWRGLAR